LFESIVMRRTAVPRESVASIALSKVFAEGLVLGATGVEEFALEDVFVEQPASANIAEIATVTTAAVVRMKLNYPNQSGFLIPGDFMVLGRNNFHRVD
jgi:hypothetical protein